jgi:hypothetical protein
MNIDLLGNFAVTLPDVWLTFILSVAAPMIAGLVTKRFADSATKRNVLILIVVLTSVLQELGGTFQLGEFAVKAFMGFFLAAGLHYQLLKPVGVTGTQGVITKILPDAGIGKNYPNAELPEPKGGPGDDTYVGPDLSDPENPASAI